MTTLLLILGWMVVAYTIGGVANVVIYIRMGAFKLGDWVSVLMIFATWPLWFIIWVEFILRTRK